MSTRHDQYDVQKNYRDGEILGVDNDGKLILWDGDKKEPYNCGETLAEFGTDNLTDREIHRLGLRADRKITNTIEMPWCTEMVSDDGKNVADWVKNILEAYQQGRPSNPDWAHQQMMFLLHNFSSPMQGRIHECRAQVVARNCELNRLRAELSAAREAIKVLVHNGDFTEAVNAEGLRSQREFTDRVERDSKITDLPVYVLKA